MSQQIPDDEWRERLANLPTVEDDDTPLHIQHYLVRYDAAQVKAAAARAAGRPRRIPAMWRFFSTEEMRERLRVVHRRREKRDRMLARRADRWCAIQRKRRGLPTAWGPFRGDYGCLVVTVYRPGDSKDACERTYLGRTSRTLEGLR